MPNKEKKILTAEQNRLADLTESETNNHMQEEIDQVKAILHNSEDEIVTALHDCDNNVELAVQYLLDVKKEAVWKEVKKKKKRASRDYPLRNNQNMDRHSQMGHGGSGWNSPTFQCRDNNRNSAIADVSNKMNTWIPQESNKSVSLKTTDEFPAVEDLDNDEYTESLAEGKIINLETDFKTKKFSEAQLKLSERLATQTDNHLPLQKINTPSKSQSTILAGISQQTYSTTDYTLTTCNDDIKNYSLTYSALPQRSRRRTFKYIKESSKVSTNVENLHVNVLKSSVINNLEGEFRTMNFNNSNESSDISINATIEKINVNKYSVPTSVSSVTGSTTVPPVEITSMTFQSSQQPKVMLTKTKTIQNDNNVYPSKIITNSRIVTGMPDLINSTPTESVIGSYSGTLLDYQTQCSSASVYQNVLTPTASVYSAVSQSPFHQNVVNATVVSSASNVTTPINNAYQTNRSIHSTNHTVAETTNPSTVFMYNNFNSFPPVSAMYTPFPIPQYQTTPAGITQTQYYGDSSLSNLSAATYGGSPYHKNYLNQQTPMWQNQNVTGSSLVADTVSNKAQYDGLLNTSVTGNVPSMVNAGSINNLSTSTLTEVPSSSGSSGKKILPNIPPGVQPLLGHAVPQCVIRQLPIPLYPPFINYNEVCNMSSGMALYLQAPEYLNLNSMPQTNIASSGREVITYSPILDRHFTQHYYTMTPMRPFADSAIIEAIQQIYDRDFYANTPPPPFQMTYSGTASNNVGINAFTVPTPSTVKEVSTVRRPLI